jgi:hypothetical protein
MLLRVQQEELHYDMRQAAKRQIQAHAIALAMLEKSRGSLSSDRCGLRRKPSKQ